MNINAAAADAWTHDAHTMAMTMSAEDREVWDAAASLFLDDDDDQLMDDDGHLTDQDTSSGHSGSPVSFKNEVDNFTQKQDPLSVFEPSFEETSASGKPTRRVNRRRQEILFLRDQVQCLQDRLTSTRARMEESMELGRNLAPMERELLAAAWSAVATQQLEQRQQSEAEHDRLVALVEEQRQLAKALQRYARRQSSQDVPEPLAVYAHLEGLQQDTTSLDNSGSFEDLQRAVTSMYHQRDAVFNDPRFDTVLSSVRASRVVNARTPRVCVELMDARVVPFSVEATASALWESMVNRVATAVTYNNEASEIQNDRLKKSFVAALDLPHFQTSVRGKVIVQRIVEASRIVILRATLFAPISLSKGVAEPFSISHYQWTVIEAPHHERLRKNSNALAQIQSFDLSFPKPANPQQSLHHTQESVMLKFCETAVAYHLDLSRQAVENILVSRCMGSLPGTASPHAHAQRYTGNGDNTTVKLEAC